MVETHPCSEEWLAPTNINNVAFRLQGGCYTLKKTQDFKKAWQMDGKKMMEVGKDFCRSLRGGKKES